MIVLSITVNAIKIQLINDKNSVTVAVDVNSR